MITFRFGLQADMRSAALTKPAFSTLIGDIVAIESNNRTQVTATTTKDGSVVLAGRFKFSNRNSLQDSDVTGVTFLDSSGRMLMSLAGVGDVSFRDVARQEKVQSITNFMLQDANLGVVVQGSAFDDILLGYGGADRLFGNVGADILRGGLGNDTLSGGVGDDRLEGGIGKDIMAGGKGDDFYLVDNTTDTVLESASSGNDSAQASVDWTMGAHLEKLSLTGSLGINGTGNAQDNILLGNSAANTLRGLDGNDRLDGERGADRLEGGRGNDLFTVDNIGDRVIELSGQGADTIKSSVDYRLPNHVENLTLTGGGDIDATGNSLDNVLHGNRGNNVLKPGHGDDVLTGGAGADDFVIVGGAGDSLRITDFLSGTDDLLISLNAVSQLGATGAVAADRFRASGDAPVGGDDFLVYDQASGVLSYDATGNGGTLVTLASLGAGTDLLAADILII